MEKTNDFFKKRKYGLILLYWPIHFIWYELLKVSFPDDASVLIIESALDRMIPFCEWFVIPYYSWYLCIAATLLYPFFRCKREFIRASLLLIGCMVLPMIFCTLCPNGIDVSLRPDFETLGRDNIATRLVQLIYLADSPPRNVMPSMHVSVSWAMFFAVIQSKIMLKKPIFKALSGVWCIAISLSTVFIKQHSILDVFAGIGTAVLVAVTVYIAEKYELHKYFTKRKQ
ncbi:MAG: phosphatase PAP2 family protein [Clostridia bacterium]|nr:phosphatase PAP2 family protein [Clostridia bacterium]